jgi:hypothetical protein
MEPHEHSQTPLVLYVRADRTAPKGTLAFHAWRGQALTAASARRELWRVHHQHSTKWLRAQLAMHEFHLTEYCRPYRSDNLRNVSRWYVRLICTELRRRGASASLTRQGSQS